MATQAFSGFFFDAGLVSGSINYDTVSFAVVSVTFQNLSPKNAAVTIIDASDVKHVLTLAANTNQTSINASSLGLVMATSVGINPKTGLSQTFVNFPTGWQISCAWPA